LWFLRFNWQIAKATSHHGKPGAKHSNRQDGPRTVDRRARLSVGQTSTVRTMALGSFSRKVRITIVDDSIKQMLRTTGKKIRITWCRDTTVSCWKRISNQLPEGQKSKRYNVVRDPDGDATNKSASLRRRAFLSLKGLPIICRFS